MTSFEGPPLKGRHPVYFPIKILYEVTPDFFRIEEKEFYSLLEALKKTDMISSKVIQITRETYNPQYLIYVSAKILFVVDSHTPEDLLVILYHLM